MQNLQIDVNKEKQLRKLLLLIFLFSTFLRYKLIISTTI